MACTISDSPITDSTGSLRRLTGILQTAVGESSLLCLNWDTAPVLSNRSLLPEIMFNWKFILRIILRVICYLFLLFIKIGILFSSVYELQSIRSITQTNNIVQCKASVNFNQLKN